MLRDRKDVPTLFTTYSVCKLFNKPSENGKVQDGEFHVISDSKYSCNQLIILKLFIISGDLSEV